MKIHGTIAAIAICGVSACGGSFHARSEALQTSICEINAHPKNYLGKTVIVTATHETFTDITDHLIDESCSGPNTLEISDWSNYASVNSYELAREKECAGLGFCSLKASVVVELTIEMATVGHMNYGPTEAGRLRHVLSFEFIRK